MRSFVIALTVLATTLAACADTHGTPAASSALSESAAAPHLETFTSDAAGFDTHSFWLDTGHEVVVFDAQFTPTTAQLLIAEITSKTRSPIRYVVLTHPNPDKFNGAPAFQALGARVVASDATARAIPGVHAYKKGYFVNVAKSFTESTYPAQATVDLTFTGDLELPLAGGAKILLHELAHPGVSSTQTVAFVPQANALVVGDLVHVKAHAWLEGGIVQGKPAPDLDAWKLALDELRTYRGATVYGGRGGTAPVEEAVTSQQAYLDKMRALVRAYVKDLGPKRSELNGPKAGLHHRAIATRAAEELPGYAFPYLVEYGAYGLIDQIAAE